MDGTQEQKLEEFDEAYKPLWRVATAELTLGKSVIEAPGRAWIDLPLSNDRVIDLVPDEPFTIEEGFVVALPDKIEVVLATPALLQAIPREGGDFTIRLPEGARLHFPKGQKIKFHSSQTRLPTGTEIAWPTSDEEKSDGPKLKPVFPRDQKIPLFWLHQGASITLREGGFLWFEQAHRGKNVN